MSSENNTTSPKADKNKQVLISETIKRFIDLGMPVNEAVDLVLGEGTYRKIADDIHDQLTAKARHSLPLDAADLQEEAEAMGWDD